MEFQPCQHLSLKMKLQWERPPTKTQVEIQERRSGPLRRYLEKDLGIRVGTATDAESHFAIYDGPRTSETATSQFHCPKMPDR